MNLSNEEISFLIALVRKQIIEYDMIQSKLKEEARDDAYKLIDKLIKGKKY